MLRCGLYDPNDPLTVLNFTQSKASVGSRREASYVRPKLFLMCGIERSSEAHVCAKNSWHG